MRCIPTGKPRLADAGNQTLNRLELRRLKLNINGELVHLTLSLAWTDCVTASEVLHLTVTRRCKTTEATDMTESTGMVNPVHHSTLVDRHEHRPLAEIHLEEEWPKRCRVHPCRDA